MYRPPGTRIESLATKTQLQSLLGKGPVYFFAGRPSLPPALLPAGARAQVIYSEFPLEALGYGEMGTRYLDRFRQIFRLGRISQIAAAGLGHALSRRARSGDPLIDFKQLFKMLRHSVDARLRRTRPPCANALRGHLPAGAGWRRRHRPHRRCDRSAHSRAQRRWRRRRASGTISGVPEHSASASTRPKVSAAEPWISASALAIMAGQTVLVVDATCQMHMPGIARPSAPPHRAAMPVAHNIQAHRPRRLRLA